MDKQTMMLFWTDELGEVRTHKKEFLEKTAGIVELTNMMMCQR